MHYTQAYLIQANYANAHWSFVEPLLLTAFQTRVHVKIISAILRHSSIKITMDIYGHTEEESLRADLDELAVALSKKEA